MQCFDPPAAALNQGLESELWKNPESGSCRHGLPWLKSAGVHDPIPWLGHRKADRAGLPSGTLPLLAAQGLLDEPEVHAVHEEAG